MESTVEVLKQLPLRSGINHSCLIPNEKALELFHSTGSNKHCDEIALFLAASESFNKANLNRSVKQSLEICQAVAEKAQKSSLRFRGYVSTVIGCPFEGSIDVKQVASLTKALLDMGCYEVSLGDTIGIGVPQDWEKLLNAIAKRVSLEKLAIHAHDTYGTAIASVLRAVDMGINTVDSSIAGLGGCPYAPGATGNVPTEDVVYALHQSGHQTGIDLLQAAATGQWISDHLGRKNGSKAGSAVLAKYHQAERLRHISEASDCEDAYSLQK